MSRADVASVRVLVVDDDPEILELFRAVAKEHRSVELMGALSPEAAMTLSRDMPPDAILLDHHFPTADLVERTDAPTRANRGMTGLEAVEFLRSVAPDAVIAIYTGARGLDESVQNSGADMYVVKGPDPRVVLDELTYLARQRRGD